MSSPKLLRSHRGASKSRGRRRDRTKAVERHRNRVFEQVCGWSPRIPGQSKVKSPFDCGNARCFACSKEAGGNPKYRLYDQMLSGENRGGLGFWEPDEYYDEAEGVLEGLLHAQRVFDELNSGEPLEWLMDIPTLRRILAQKSESPT